MTSQLVKAVKTFHPYPLPFKVRKVVDTKDLTIGNLTGISYRLDFIASAPADHLALFQPCAGMLWHEHNNHDTLILSLLDNQYIDPLAWVDCFGY
ncbi:hypothetical protein HMPREF0539_1571 [Lacticaseibacillus rhamnosus LMS2-1]|uniref:Uncharacterized protein n=1 Tax=Lacticaseibacillus rhamnosus (strain LMS2-1) TaxID=525361 RepID=C2JXD7_LACRM|nr:hypothetical protein HMPREF0539_1571 [Lacticaseibacillus rhamnosus LMS2-1]